MKRQFTLLAVALILSGITMAQNPQRQKMGQRQKMVEARSEKPDRGERFAQALELTDEQKTKIEAIHFESMKASKTVKNNMREKEARLNTLSTADKPDNKAIEKVAKEIGDLRTEMFVNQVQTQQKIRALLDEKQKMKFDQMNSMRKQKRNMGDRPKRG